jgi:hypothetical protein
MAHGWTPERRARQAALIRTWRPWAHSTGPRTAEGKAQAAVNARAFHGWTPELLAMRHEVRASTRHMADLLRQQKETLAELARGLACGAVLGFGTSERARRSTAADGEV